MKAKTRTRKFLLVALPVVACPMAYITICSFTGEYWPNGYELFATAAIGLIIGCWVAVTDN